MRTNRVRNFRTRRDVAGVAHHCLCRASADSVCAGLARPKGHVNRPEVAETLGEIRISDYSIRGRVKLDVLLNNDLIEMTHLEFSYRPPYEQVGLTKQLLGPTIGATGVIAHRGRSRN